ncbi:MAG: AraC family transcriptional regulator [Albidovulum sp.]|nr:AraC family transcriptional regulator [Albidovulum sp.]
MSTANSVVHGGFGRVALIELDRSTVRHAQKEAHLLVHLGGAGGTVSVGTRELSVDSTAAVAVNPWKEHGFRLEANGQKFRGVAIYFDKEWYQLRSESKDLAFEFGRPAIRATKQISDATHLIAEMLLNGLKKSGFESGLFSLVQEVYQQSWRNVHGAQPLDRALARFNDNRIRQSVTLLEDNFCSCRGIDWLAGAVRLSRPQFFKLFKKQTGVSPNVYLNALRTERAIDRLVNTEAPLREISSDLGFSSQAGFSRFFASIVGVSPNAYRRAAYTI